jgi:hypothetical protein
MDEAHACACAQKYDRGDLLAGFAAVRDGCPVLKQLLLPDAIWPDFQKAAAAPADDALHQSMLVLAFERGHLARLTSPLHRYLMNGEKVGDGLRYVNDLPERWLFKTDTLERHSKARAFMGKLTELHAAQWLEHDGWRITELEAFREGPDIGAERETPASFEVKYLGQEDSDFQAVVESLKNGPTVETQSLYAPVNYLVFRVYEAAKQLQRVKTRRVVIFVANETTWHRLALQIKNNWIDWSKAKLYDAGKPWQDFLEKQLGKYPDIEKDGELAATIRSLDDLWIVKLCDGFELVREYDFKLAGERAAS